jgi:hypothetical protein
MPLGFHMSVYRQQSNGNNPASFGDAHGTCLAVWQTGFDGLHWLKGLVKQHKAVFLGGCGYPLQYTAEAQHIIPSLRNGPPSAMPVWTVDAGDVLLPGWLGKTTKYPEAMDICRSDEWLIIEAWDRS